MKRVRSYVLSHLGSDDERSLPVANTTFAHGSFVNGRDELEPLQGGMLPILLAQILNSLKAYMDNVLLKRTVGSPFISWSATPTHITTLPEPT